MLLYVPKLSPPAKLKIIMQLLKSCGTVIVLCLLATNLMANQTTAAGQQHSAPHAKSALPAQSMPDVEQSTAFSTVQVDEYARFQVPSDGDLWVNAWADDDVLYVANGDGYGFSLLSGSHDIAVSKVLGNSPDTLYGDTIAHGDAVGSIWTPGSYNRKPTGMICVDGVLYLAIQDLNFDFNDAPAASISKSVDRGVTWQWDRTAPMFKDYRFTTIMFVDYGKNNENAPDDYVYAYGLDNNWRDSFNGRVADPTHLYLARVHKNSIQDRSKWQFFAGTNQAGQPTWSGDMEARRTVLQTDRRVYTKPFWLERPHNMTVLSQGGVVYNRPLKRYIYSSWTEYTWEFYESPTPWGPWRQFLSKDFGGYPWSAHKHGGYGTTIPSKFISPDGLTMYVQSNTFISGIRRYGYALQKMVVSPYQGGTPTNRRDNSLNLARQGTGTTVVAKSIHYGNARYLHDGVTNHSEDDWDQDNKPLSWWGYVWQRPYHMNKLVYTSGRIFPDGGWFRTQPRVQVRQNFQWVDVENLSVTPAYPGNESAGPYKAYTFNFKSVSGDGIRIIGEPGGERTFTSIAELEVYYATE
jgi:hypothetical protein